MSGSQHEARRSRRAARGQRGSSEGAAERGSCCFYLSNLQAATLAALSLHSRLAVVVFLCSDGDSVPGCYFQFLLLCAATPTSASTPTPTSSAHTPLKINFTHTSAGSGPRERECAREREPLQSLHYARGEASERESERMSEWATAEGDRAGEAAQRSIE